MNKNDLRFFEEYKKLDLQLKDLLEENAGVSAYLAAMEETAPKDQAAVPGWNADYRQLKHLRRARNRLAHQPENSDSVTTKKDLLDLQDFSRRISDGTDPLSLSRAAGDRSGRVSEEKRSALLWLILLLLLVAVLTGLIIYSFVS